MAVFSMGTYKRVYQPYSWHDVTYGKYVMLVSYIVLIWILSLQIKPPKIDDDDPEDQRTEAEIQQAKKEEYEAKANRQLRHVLVIFVIINLWASWRFFIGVMKSAPDTIVLIEVCGRSSSIFYTRDWAWGYRASWNSDKLPIHSTTNVTAVLGLAKACYLTSYSAIFHLYSDQLKETSR